MPESVGTQLKQAREARKLSLEQVFQATRIAVRFLQGLENDQPAVLPSAVQGKGFLRLYADFLKLNVQALVDQWEGKLPPEPPAEDEIQTTVETQVEAEESPDVVMLEASEPEAVDQIIEEAPEIEIVPVDEEAHQELEPLEPQRSQVIFNDIGVLLRDRRLSLGLTIEDVERFTRLRRHYLNALEEGRTTDLPSLVQGRGMLSNYARFLELDVETLLLRFADALQERRAEHVSIAAEQPNPSSAKKRSSQPARGAAPAWRRFLTPDLMIGGVIILSLIGFALWGAAQVSALRKQAEQPTLMPIAGILAQTTTPTLDSQANLSIPPTLAPNAELGNLPVDVESAEVTPTGIPLIGDAPLQVYVVARKRAWLRVLVDETEAFNGRIVPGNAYPFAGDDQIEVITGDASALQIFYNQLDLGSLGNNAEVKQLIFNAEGILTPTPSFSATPTATRAATITPTPTPTQPTPTVTPFIPNN